MLTNRQIEELCEKMDVPLETCCYKSTLKEMKLKHNRSYIINLEDELDKNGKRNDGSHWVCFQVDGTEDEYRILNEIVYPDEKQKALKQKK